MNKEKNEFSHVDEHGSAKMVDVGDKKNQKRTARAKGFIWLEENTIRLVDDNKIKKGDVLTVAKIAGILGAKLTSQLIPLCHPLALTKIDVRTFIEKEGVAVQSEVSFVGKTGVEMEALTAVQIALLTIYDMCKAVDKNMVIGDIKLVEKTKEDL